MGLPEIPLLENGNIDLVRLSNLIDWDAPPEWVKVVFSMSRDYERLTEELARHPEMARMRWLGGDTFLHVAACDGEFELVKLLLENNADPNAADENGSTPLLEAAYGGFLKIVRLLLASGADPNAAGYTNCIGPAIHQAACGGAGHEIIAELLANGGQLDALDDDGNSALDVAIKWSNSEEVDVLLEHGATTSDPDSGRLLRRYLRTGYF